MKRHSIVTLKFEGERRSREVDMSKTDMAVIMIKKAIRCLKVDYVLMDSWFTSERMIECVRSYTKQNVHLIGMMKMSKAKMCTKTSSTVLRSF